MTQAHHTNGRKVNPFEYITKRRLTEEYRKLEQTNQYQQITIRTLACFLYRTGGATVVFEPGKILTKEVIDDVKKYIKNGEFDEYIKRIR